METSVTIDGGGHTPKFSSNQFLKQVTCLKIMQRNNESCHLCSVIIC